MINIAFFGTPQISKTVLEYLNNCKEINIKAVITKEDKKQGRKLKQIPCITKLYAMENNLNVIDKLNDKTIEYLKTLDLDFIVVVAYGKILKKQVLEIPKKAPINLHVSKLPKYRGAAPIQWAVLNGDTSTAATTMIMNEKMDEGDILLQEDVAISNNETAGELFDAVSKVGGPLMVKTLLDFDNITPKKQEGEVSLAPMIEKSIAKISWDSSYKQIHNKVRGLNPYLGAYTNLEGTRIKIWKTIADLDEYVLEELFEYNSCENGTIIVLQNRIFVKTNDGFIEVLELQKENSKKVGAKDFLNGHNLDGKIFR